MQLNIVALRPRFRSDFPSLATPLQNKICGERREVPLTIVDDLGILCQEATFVKRQLRCSFCHKPQDAVAKLIASGAWPRSYICGECIAVCNSILEHDPPSPSPERPRGMLKKLRQWIPRLLRHAAAEEAV